MSTNHKLQRFDPEMQNFIILQFTDIRHNLSTHNNNNENTRQIASDAPSVNQVEKYDVAVIKPSMIQISC